MGDVTMVQFGSETASVDFETKQILDILNQDLCRVLYFVVMLLCF